MTRAARKEQAGLSENVSAAILELFPPLGELEQRISLALYRLLARGEPVARAALAAAAGAPLSEIDAALSDWYGVYRDGRDRVIGYWGLSLAPTNHRMRIDGRLLHTWCAWDTLFIPELLGASARVESSCPVTRAPIALAVHRDGVETESGDPPYVSLLAPDPAKVRQDVVLNFCNYVHFFSSAQAAQAWTARHPGTLAVTLREAWRLGRKRNATRYPGALRLKPNKNQGA